ncbi:Trihydroxynaphthalene reductase [Dispira simplex]|nr:Trihydroxynaphthalene reductase [Dispira simplex]
MTRSSEAPSHFEISVPASSANIGPGFDTLGLAFSLHLRLQVHVDRTTPSRAARLDEHHQEIEDVARNVELCTLFDQSVTIRYTEQNSHELAVKPSRNLITKTAWYVLRCHGLLVFPYPVDVIIDNPIPLGRGLGSSGAAVVAGVALANTAASLGLSKDRLLDYALAIERHPDNVSASLLGGFVASYLDDTPNASATKLLESRFQPVDIHTQQTDAFAPSAMAPRMPPMGISRYVQLPWNPFIKAIAVIPQFQLATVKARAALPDTYTRADLVFNLQRLAVLTHALGQDPPNPLLIHAAMSDRVHQIYRAALVPGLEDLLRTMVPTEFPGLLGLCLSGAGPTVIILAQENFDTIGKKACSIFAEHQVKASYQVLNVDRDGLQCKTIA